MLRDPVVGEDRALDIPKAIEDLIALSERLLDRIRAGDWINARDLGQERSQGLAALFGTPCIDELLGCRNGLQRLQDIDCQLLAAGREARNEQAVRCKSLQQMKKRHQAYTES